MSEKAHSKGSLSLIIGLLILMTGCGVTQVASVSMVDVTVPPPAVIKKIPMKVAIVIPKDVESYTFAGGPQDPGRSSKDMQVGFDANMTIPLGQGLKRHALDAMSYVFEEAVLIQGRPYPRDADAVVFPKIERFQYWYKIISNNPFNRKWESNAEISIKATVLDRNGMLLFEGTQDSQQVRGGIFNANKTAEFPEYTGRAAAVSITAALRRTAEALAVSREIHTYAFQKGKPEILAASAPRDLSPVVTSDVDDLPRVEVKKRNNAYAIVIGIETYRQKLPKADYAERDARTMVKYLSNVMGYPEDNIVQLLDDHATKSDMKKYLEKWLFNNVDRNSTVFVYFSGHGAPDPATGDVFLVPYDGDPTFIDETGYSLNKLYKVLEKLPAREIIITLDSCFSGAGGRSVLAKGARPLVMNLNTASVRSERIAVLSASSGNQISSTYEEQGHGLFTYFLMKGIKEGHTEVRELYDYLKPKVMSIARKKYNNEQTPQLIMSDNQQIKVLIQ